MVSFGMPMGQMTSTRKTTRLTELPQDVLIRIAAIVSSSASLDALHLSEASQALCAAVSAAKKYTLILTPGPEASRWALLHGENTLHVTSLTPSSAYGVSEKVLQPCITVLQTATGLHSVDIHANLKCLQMVRWKQHSSLRDLTLRVSQAEMHTQILETMRGLSRLTKVHLYYAPDYSLLSVPHAQRCACYPLRRDPDALVQAAPLVTSFGVFCGCMNAVKCTAPLFSALEQLTLGGNLPTLPPPTLEAIAPSLTSLTLIDTTDITRAISLAAALSPVVSGLSVGVNPPRRFLTSALLHCIANTCPRLEVLNVGLHNDSEVEIKRLAPTLRELRVTFRPREIGYGDGVQFHPLRKEVLSELASGMPVLHVFVLRSVRIDIEELQKFLQAGGHRLTSLSLPVHGQAERIDAFLCSLLEIVARFCTALRKFEVQEVPQMAISKHGPAIHADPTALNRLSRTLGMMHRRLPFTEIEQLEKLIDRLLTPKH